MNFGALLKATLKENSIPVSHFAEAIGYNRVAIYSVFKGEKSLPENVFKEMLEKYDFSPSQRALLTREFYNDSMDEKTSELIRFFLSELACIGEEPSSIMLPFRELDTSVGGVFLAGSVDYYSAIRTFLENESLEKGAVIYTNYSFFDIQADKIVYDFIKERSCEDILIRHTVRPNDVTPLNERIRNICASVKFARLGHITSLAGENVGDYAFSTYFIGKTSILLYDNSHEFGFLSTEKTAVSAYILAAEKCEADETPLTRFTKNPFELKSILQTYQLEIHSAFDSDFSLHYFTTPDILENTLKKEILNREQILSACWGHVEYCQEFHMKSLIMSQRGLLRFFEDGKAFDASDLLLNRVSFADRKKAFENYKNRLKDPDFCVKMLNSDLVPTTGNFSVEVYDGGVLFAFDAKNRPDGDYLGASFLILMDPELSAVFKKIPEYLEVNGCLLPNSFVENLLENLINQCEAAAREQD